MGLRLDQAVAQQLLATTAVTSLSSNRIYPLVAPQGAGRPFVVYQQISMVPVHAMVADSKLKERRFQVSAFAATYAGAKALSEAVETSLKDYQADISGLFGDGTSGVNVQRIFLESEMDFTDIDPETREVTYHASKDFIIWATT